MALAWAEIDAALRFWTPGAWQTDSGNVPSTFAAIGHPGYEETIRGVLEDLYLHSPTFQKMLSDWVTLHGTVQIGATTEQFRGHNTN
jgi:hypothetical protein